MYIAYPIRLEFKLDEQRHTVATATKWGGLTFNLSGNLKAVIGECRATSISNLVEDVREYLKEFPDIKDKKVLISDFRLIYDCNEVQNNRVWSGGHVISTYDL